MAELLGDSVRPGQAAAESLMARRIAAVFALYALVATAFLAVNIPPFQNPDEHAHFLRAAQIAQGELVGMRFERIEADGKPHLTAGGLTDPALVKASWPFNVLIFHPEKRVQQEYWAPKVHWSRERALEKFANTVINPPIFYLPSAAGVLIGKMTRMTVVQSLMLSRGLTAVAAIAVGAAAIALAGGAAPWFFAVLTLPMSLSLIASSSQDALLLGCATLGSALMVRILRHPDRPHGRGLVAMTVALALVAMARPPYGTLALLPLALPHVPWRQRLIAAGTVAGCLLIWTGINTLTVMTNMGAFLGADPPAQIALLVRDPLLAVQVVWTTLAQSWPDYVETFVGRLGWLDTLLPVWYRHAALTMLAVAGIAAALGLPRRGTGPRSRSLVVAALLLATAGTFGAGYLTWSAPGSPTVYGVQGRYFLVLALAGAALLPALGQRRLAWLHTALVGAVIAFPVVSLTVVMRAVVLRYYLG